MKSGVWGIFFLSSALFAFPEMIRHNYVNCTSCHVSPSGGGILTPYGKSLSGEVASTWATENEGKFAWGVVELPKEVNIGGDVRFLQMYQDNTRFKETRFITMQADVEVAAGTDDYLFVGTLGKSNNMKATTIGEALVSHRHYVMYKPAQGFSVRFGRFQKNFGINTPEHTLVTKKGLGWDENTETYNLEGAYLGEEWDLFLTANFGRIDNKYYDREWGPAIRGGYNLSDSQKVGLSYMYGSNRVGHRHVFGPYAEIGFTKKLYLLFEFDYQSSQPNSGASTSGWVNYTRGGYEIFKGLQVYATNEFSKLNTNNPLSYVHTYGLGVQWLPRPHFELNAVWERSKMEVVSSQYAEITWLMAHLYL